MSEGADWDSLALLLGASSKKSALKFFSRAYVHRNSPHEMPLREIATEFKITEDQARKLSGVLVILVKTTLYESSVASAMEIVNTKSPDLDPRLRALIEQILSSQLADWREASVLARPSLPRFVGVDWRVEVKTESDKVARMAVPSVLVDLKLQDQPSLSDRVPCTRHVDFELSKEALQTMLDGLGRIRDQLGAVAGTK